MASSQVSRKILCVDDDARLLTAMERRLLEALNTRGSTFRATINTGNLAGVRMWTAQSQTPLVESVVLQEHSMPAPELDHRILLVEDGADNQRLISFLLRKAGATVTVADNGKDAVELALDAEQRNEPFDAILMDMHMPVMDGDEATRCLRDRGYRGRIVALTAFATADDRAHCLASGCDAFVTKPIDRTLLIETIAGGSQPSSDNAAARAS